MPGYATAHELCPGEPRLYGTESLYGDWNGRVLLLAKDFAPSRLLRCRIRAGVHRPYRHEPEMRTNKTLIRLAGPHEHMGLLYGSALANLLRDDGQLSGSLPNREQALAYGTEVLRYFVIENMPRLESIVCMGAEAWKCASRATGVAGDWQEYRDSGKRLGKLVAVFHPAARVAKARMEAPWTLLSA